jgi:UDP-N-acetyl-D-mannosaminuronic acid transferase (WecB/TagA/CpsF family)
VKKEIIRLIENGDKITILSVNGEIISRSEKDKGVRESLEEGTINLPDRFSTIMLAKKEEK